MKKMIIIAGMVLIGITAFGFSSRAADFSYNCPGRCGVVTEADGQGRYCVGNDTNPYTGGGFNGGYCGSRGCFGGRR